MGARGAGLLDRIALFVVYAAFVALNAATAGVAETLGIGAFTKAFTAVALLGAPLSLHGRAFGLALALIAALATTEALLYALALGATPGYADATRAFVSPRLHL